MVVDVWEEAIRHLGADPAMARIIERVGDRRLVPDADGTHFGALVRSIVFQQLSGKAARTIYLRLLGLFGDRVPTAKQLLATSEEALRSVGLSRQKTQYLYHLANAVESGAVPVDALHELDDESIQKALVTIKGIGRWTAQMFMMFRLGRPDVWPDLDLGIQKALMLAYGLEAMPKPAQVVTMGARWSPYRTIASWYLWRSLENGDGQLAIQEGVPRGPED